MRTVNLAQVLSWVPCDEYPVERLLELANGRESISASEICDLPIPDGDKMWALCHDELTGWKERRLIGCAIIDFALGQGPHDKLSRLNDEYRQFLTVAATPFDFARLHPAARNELIFMPDLDFAQGRISWAMLANTSASFGLFQVAIDCTKAIEAESKNGSISPEITAIIYRMVKDFDQK